MVLMLSTYLKEVLNTLQSIIFRQKQYLEIQKNSSSFPPGSRFKCVTEIKGKERELLSHPHFIYEGFTSLLNPLVHGVH